MLRFRFHIPQSVALLGSFLALLLAPPAARSAEKTIVKDMKDVFYQSTPLTTPTGQPTPAVAETTIFHRVFFDDFESGAAPGWAAVDMRAGQPNAWNIVSGTHACVGNAWWMGQTGFPYGDGYGNNWVQSLKTNVSINLTGTSNNKLTYKYRFQSEYLYDWGWVLIKPSGSGAHWDTLAMYSGDFGGSCINASITIPDSFTTKTQPISLQFLFGSDLDSSTADTGSFPATGWSLDDVKITASGNVVKFFDDMESGPGQWVTSAPAPGSLWHIENSPATSLPASCFFLNTNLWVPFQGFGFGSVPDWADAMLTTPPMDLEGVFEGTPLNTTLRLQYDDWVNLPFQRGMYWSLWIQGSNDLVTWTPWRNALFPLAFSSENVQCNEGQTLSFNPYNTARTGVQPDTRYIRLGFRLRDDRAVGQDGQILTLGLTPTEGIYFDDIGVYYVYTISGVEEVPVPVAPSRASIRKVFPNPFNPSTTIEFGVPSTGRTAVRIYDVRGRRLATLVNQEMGPGVYRIRWSGKTDDGRDLSSGVYFARVETRMGSDAVRVMMLK